MSRAVALIVAQLERERSRRDTCAPVQFSFISLAEGIENEGQATWLSEHGCARGQGFLVSRPLPLGDFQQLLHRTNGIRTGRTTIALIIGAIERY
jgi:predicted signal transduction protein with EAL and GGDEF domain